MDMNPFQKWILRSFNLLTIFCFEATVVFIRTHCTQIVGVTKASFDSTLLVFIPVTLDDKI